MSRLYFREIGGRKVFYPFGWAGAGYLVTSPLKQRIHRFLRVWAVCVALVASAQIAAHAALEEVGEELLLAFLAAYALLAVVYGVRMAAYIRRLKIMPLQADPE